MATQPRRALGLQNLHSLSTNSWERYAEGDEAGHYPGDYVRVQTPGLQIDSGPDLLN